MPTLSGFPGVGVGVESVQVGAARYPPTPHPRSPPLPSTFSFLPNREGGANRPSPHPPPPQCRATFAVSKLSHHVGTPDPRPTGQRATVGLPAQDPGASPLPAAPQALTSPLTQPSGTGRGNSSRHGHPRPSQGAPSQAWRSGGGDADSGQRAGPAGGCHSRAAVQCRSRAPRAAGTLARTGTLQNGGAGRRQPLESWLAAACAGSET